MFVSSRHATVSGVIVLSLRLMLLCARALYGWRTGVGLWVLWLAGGGRREQQRMGGGR